MAQMPAAVDDESKSISGVWHWWTVTASPSVGTSIATMDSAPTITAPASFADSWP